MAGTPCATFQQQYADAQAAWWAAVEPQYFSTVTQENALATTYQATADGQSLTEAQTEASLAVTHTDTVDAYDEAEQIAQAGNDETQEQSLADAADAAGGYIQAMAQANHDYTVAMAQVAYEGSIDTSYDPTGDTAAAQAALAQAQYQATHTYGVNVAAANGQDETSDAQAEVQDTGNDAAADETWTAGDAQAEQTYADAESGAYQTLSTGTAGLDAAWQEQEANSDSAAIAAPNTAGATGSASAGTPWSAQAAANAAALAAWTQSTATAGTTNDDTLAGDEHQFEISQAAADAVFSQQSEAASAADDAASAEADLARAQSDAASIASQAASDAYNPAIPDLPASSPSPNQPLCGSGLPGDCTPSLPYGYLCPDASYDLVNRLATIPLTLPGDPSFGVLGYRPNPPGVYDALSDNPMTSNVGYPLYPGSFGWSYPSQSDIPVAPSAFYGVWAFSMSAAVGTIRPDVAGVGFGAEISDGYIEITNVWGYVWSASLGSPAWDTMQNLPGMGTWTPDNDPPGGTTTADMASGVYGLPASISTLAGFQPAAVATAGGDSLGIGGISDADVSSPGVGGTGVSPVDGSTGFGGTGARLWMAAPASRRCRQPSTATCSRSSPRPGRPRPGSPPAPASVAPASRRCLPLPAPPRPPPLPPLPRPSKSPSLPPARSPRFPPRCSFYTASGPVPPPAQRPANQRQSARPRRRFPRLRQSRPPPRRAAPPMTGRAWPLQRRARQRPSRPGPGLGRPQRRSRRRPSRRPRTLAPPIPPPPRPRPEGADGPQASPSDWNDQDVAVALAAMDSDVAAFWGRYHGAVSSSGSGFFGQHVRPPGSFLARRTLMGSPRFRAFGRRCPTAGTRRRSPSTSSSNALAEAHSTGIRHASS